MVAGSALAVVIPYMQGFHDATVAHVQYGGWSFARMVDFSLCFFGNIAPVAPVARCLGAVSIAAAAVILFNFRRFVQEPVFHFLLYLLSVAAAGVLCRSALPGAGLFYRFEIIAISILCCECYLLALLVTGTSFERLFRIFMTASMPIAILGNMVALYVGGPILKDRKAEIEYGYRVWPEQRDKLVHWDHAEGDRIMQAYVDRKFGGRLPMAKGK